MPESRAVLVTGGSGGIGAAVVRAFGERGDRVAVTYRDDGEGAEALAPGRAVRMDLEAPETIAPAVEDAIARLGGLDTLVVNAVRWPQVQAERFEDVAEEEWRAVLRANLEGAFATVRAGLPALRESGRGRVVLISSGIATEGMPATWAYAAAKAGLHGFARALAWDLGADGGLVNVVSVGFTATPPNRERFGDEIFERVGRLVPLRRVSSAEDVARLIVFLGSSENTSVTGEVVAEGTSTAKTPLAAAAG
jgi:NAD(P)-dependent dehydrogenase (short-subunit alcohol dehydrogenase family)